jgi:uncharacterized protein (TIGR04255 family)
MTAHPQFEPFFPAHAVESCAAAVFFDSPLPSKLFIKLMEELGAELLAAGLVEGPTGLEIQILVPDLQLGSGSSGAPRSFSTSDRSGALMLTPFSLHWKTNQYIRWSYFLQQIHSFFIGALTEYSKLLHVGAVQLEYWDRFMWSGSWDDFNCGSLLLANSPLIANEAEQKTRQWHSHAGWFDVLDSGRRQLANVNIDVQTVQSASGKSQPSVGIYTSLREDSVDFRSSKALEWFDDSQVIPTLERQHVTLKAVLKRLIKQDMADRIGL